MKIVFSCCHCIHGRGFCGHGFFWSPVVVTLSDIVMLAAPWSATTLLSVHYRKALPALSEQETDLSWLSWEYQNHHIWGKDNQNKILHDNQKIWSCNAALWKEKKKKQEWERKQSTFLPAPYRGIQSKRTVYLGQLSPKGEFSCSLFNPFSYMVVEDAKPQRGKY